MRFHSLWMLLLAVAALGGASACADRTYLTKSHGRAYNEAFERQVVNPNPRPTRTASNGKRLDGTEGLDSQEASAVSRSYRRSLAGKEGNSEGGTQGMVITNAGTGAQPAYMPPPSVPNGQ